MNKIVRLFIAIMIMGGPSLIFMSLPYFIETHIETIEISCYNRFGEILKGQICYDQIITTTNFNNNFLVIFQVFSIIWIPIALVLLVNIEFSRVEEEN